jgi:hypothetical protein
MDPFRKNKLDQMVDQHKQWEPSRMLLTVGSKVHNLIEYIGKDCVQPEGSTLLLPSIFNSTDKATRNMLLGALRYVASDAGFMLAVKGWVAGDCRLVLKCQRGFVFKSQQELSKVGKKATSTIRPMSKEHECPFFICVKWDNEKQQYKLVAGHGNRRHCHHLPKEPCDVRKGVAFQSDEQRRLNIGLYASGATSQLVRNYHLETNGNTIADGTLDYLRRLACNKSNRAVAVALGHKRVNNLGKKPLTKAEKLLQYLQSVPDVSYIALYSEQKSDLLKVSHRDFKAACRRRQLRVVRRAADELSEQEGEVLDFTQFDESLDFETFESTTRQAMAMPDENKMLLMVAWTTNYSCRKLCQYPQSTSSDTVEKLNNVQRCLYMFALTTPNRKNVPVMWTYLPAQSQWAFKWAQTRAFTFLFPSWARQKMHLHITDGDKNLYDPFRGAIQDGIFPNCVHRLCGYHFRSRGELTKTTTTKLESKGRAYYRIIKAWIRSWCCYIETLAEYEESRSIFNKWIDSDEVTNKASLTRNIAVLISKSLLTSFDPNLHKFLRCHFMKVFGYDKEASQSSETENSVIKRGPTNPSQSISRCTEGIVCNNQSREKKNNQKSAVSIDQQRVLGKIAMWKMALDELVDTAYKTCLEQSAKSEKLVLWRVSETQFYVKVRLYKDHQGKTYDSHNFDLYMVPYFERTRVVTVKTDGHGKKYLTCTCCLYERHRIPCADQLKVLGRMPTTQDCSLIHTSTYEHCYLKPGFEDVTNKMTEVLDSELDGPHFGEDADKMWIVGKSGNPETPLSYFERSLPSCPPLI